MFDNLNYRNEQNRKPIHLPAELSKDDKIGIIKEYIASDFANPNYLLDIYKNSKACIVLEIPPRVKYYAKKRYQDAIQNLGTDGFSVQNTYSIQIKNAPNDEKNINFEGRNCTLTYDAIWLKKNIDFATILNNFIYLFEFADRQMRVMLVSKPNEGNIFEKHLFRKPERFYPDNTFFNTKQLCAFLQIAVYQELLNSMGIRLEGVLQWFFSTYLHEEFSVPPFVIAISSVGSNYLEKCTLLSSIMESAVKQFSLFVQEKKIDLERLRLYPDVTEYRTIPSLLNHKYIYGKGNIFKHAAFLIFSDQSILHHRKTNPEYKERSFFNLITKHEMQCDDFLDRNQPDLQWLNDQAFITIGEEGSICCNIDKLRIMKELYENEVISYLRYPKKYRDIIDGMVAQELLEFESSLLSRPEAQYFNYYLNKKEFGNGLDLRNGYAHGAFQTIEDMEIHKQNYSKFIMLVILLAIKMNDEFCLLDEQEKKKEK